MVFCTFSTYRDLTWSLYTTRPSRPDSSERAVLKVRGLGVDAARDEDWLPLCRISCDNKPCDFCSSTAAPAHSLTPDTLYLVLATRLYRGGLYLALHSKSLSLHRLPRICTTDHTAVVFCCTRMQTTNQNQPFTTCEFSQKRRFRFEKSWSFQGGDRPCDVH